MGVKYTPLKNALKQLLITIFQQIYFANNSCNFILYILTGPSFRKELLYMFRFSEKQSSKAATTSTTMMKFGQRNNNKSSIEESDTIVKGSRVKTRCPESSSETILVPVFTSSKAT